MTYIEGFVVAVPAAKQEEYRRHAAKAVPLLREFGVRRHVETWENEVPEGKLTDFRKAVQAKEDEKIVFAWFEYESKAARDAANKKMMSDPRMAEMGSDMPFDAKRMIFGGFAPMLDTGEAAGAYVDGLVLPVPNANRDAYVALAEKAGPKFRQYGALRVVESWGDDVPEGEVTDFRRAVQAKEEENVVLSWIEWPSKAARDQGWGKIMADPDMQPDHGAMPFDGRRMFWGGFDLILDSTAERSAPERELA